MRKKKKAKTKNRQNSKRFLCVCNGNPRVRRLHPCTHRVTFKARKGGGSRKGKAQVSWGMDAVSVRPYLSRDCRMLKERPLPQLLLSRLQADIPQDPLFPVLSNLTACLSRKHVPYLLVTERLRTIQPICRLTSKCT